MPYCSECGKYITEGEYEYSKNVFGLTLCRYHQDIERNKQKKMREEQSKPEEVFVEEVIEEDIPEQSESGVKKAIFKIGKGIKKGAKAVADSTRKSMQIRRWKDDILRRMTMSQLKQFAYERRIKTTRTVLHSTSRSTYLKTINLKKGELASRLRGRIQLEDIISFAKRHHINIRDVIRDIDLKKAEWKAKKISERIAVEGSELLLELEKYIIEFRLFRRYGEEKYYQDTLAQWLKSKFPDTKIEVSRGSTRPDIVVEGVAIEIKGPTYDKDLMSIADKCMRYSQYFPEGMICVLFSVHVNPRRYEDWLRGMKEKHPEVIVIKK